MRFRVPRWLYWINDKIGEPVRDWTDVPIGVKVHGYVVRRWDVLAVISTIAISVCYAWMMGHISYFFLSVLIFVFGLMVFEWVF